MEYRCLNCMDIYDEKYEICPHCGSLKKVEPKEAYHLYPGVKLCDRYIIGTALGYGGFGTVYIAWDEKLEIKVAIKEYFPTGVVNRIPGEKSVIVYSGTAKKEFHKGLTRFLDEAKNTAIFQKHPNITNVFDYFEENGTAYFVMEYMKGVDLKTYLKENGGKLETEQIINILLSVISALKELHKHGIIHRDISPDNIFICDNGKIKLTDLGAARFSDGEDEKTLSIVLKPGYAPPEQYESRSKQGPWTDIYALGATMYRAITGVVPEESVNRKIEDTLKSPKEIIPEIPDYIDTSLMVSMSLIPELRFQKVEDFEEAILHQRKVRTLQEDLKRRRRNRRISISLVSVVILVFLGINLNTYHKKKAAALLDPASITVWVPISENPDEEQFDIGSNQTEQEIFERAIYAFQTEYPQIEVTIEYVNEDSYVSQIESAIESKNLPTVFCSDGLTGKDLDQAGDISTNLFDILSTNEYLGFKEYKNNFEEEKQVPLGVKIPVIYINSDYKDMELKDTNNDRDAFLQGDSIMYVGTSDDYKDVQQALSSRYIVSELKDEEKWISCYSNLWSIDGNAKAKEQAAGIRLLYFLLAEEAQDIYFVQSGRGLPANIKMTGVYGEVNIELNSITSNLDKVSFDEKYLFDNDYYLDSIYEKYITNKKKIDELAN